MRLAILLAGALAAGTAPAAERTLCQAGETVVFSCTLGTKLVSLCRAQPRQLSYRFGAPGRVELTHPAPGAAAGFVWSSLPGYGGGITRVIFRRGDYEYAVYSRMGRASGGGDPETEDGVTVSRGGQPIDKKVCDDGGAGFRESIEWLPRKAGE